MLRPKALDHVGLIVTDLDRSLRFYKALGLELLRRSERCTGSSAVLKVGAQEINVFCNSNSADRSGPQRIDHFCLMMEGATIDDVVQALREAGLGIASGPVKRREGAAASSTIQTVFVWNFRSAMTCRQSLRALLKFGKLCQVIPASDRTAPMSRRPV
jgi:catechol 2,3-dioxygenase-like lactoylglutathione lyase family enzyme